MSQYLTLAKQKFEQSNEVDFNMDLNDFITDCYVRLKPCSYGVRIQQKIVSDLNLVSIQPCENIGDAVIGKKRVEIKVSFLDKKGCYHLTHLRMWQKFQYYLFCLIDCENDFTPKFYVVDKYVLNKIKMTPMNGTKESNSDNINIELRSTVRKNGESHKLFIKENKLDGTSFESLKKFSDKIGIS